MHSDAASTTSTPGKANTSPKDSDGAGSSAKEHKPLEVSLQHGRMRHLGWTAFGLVAGVALIVKLGTIGQAIGAILIAVALFQGYKALLTFLNPPGTFKVGPGRVVLPTGLCRGRDLEIAPEDLQHAFFLRRAVPWTKAGPLLVVESGGKSYGFPRDWFASDSDQRRVERALNKRRGGGSAA